MRLSSLTPAIKSIESEESTETNRNNNKLSQSNNPSDCRTKHFLAKGSLKLLQASAGQKQYQTMLVGT